MTVPYTIYPIRLYGDPILRRRARALAGPDELLTVPGFEPADLESVARNMLETMYEARGVGLAAPQVGLGVRMFVAAEYEDDEEENEGKETPLKSRVLREIVMLNPVVEVTDKRPDTSYQEGCLSIPGIYEDGVKRHRAVRVRYQDLTGAEQVEEAGDYLARVYQHETDHLNGKLFLDHLPQEVTEAHRKALAAMQREAKAYLKRVEAPVSARERKGR